MPLNQDLIEKVISYCDNHIETEDKIKELFNFIKDENLINIIIQEYKSARYIYKLGESLGVSDEKFIPHAKFQIIQYASIYEVVIVHVLWNYYSENKHVKEIEYYTQLKKAASMPSNIKISTKDEKDVFLCIEESKRNSQHSIKFDDKVDAAVSIGFVDRFLGEEIKEFFRIRNGVHIENAMKNNINYELNVSQLAFWRIKPFTRGIKEFLNKNSLPESAKPKKCFWQNVGMRKLNSDGGPALKAGGLQGNSKTEAPST